MLDNTAATALRNAATAYVRPKGPGEPHPSPPLTCSLCSHFFPPTAQSAITTEYAPLARGAVPLQPGVQAPVSILTTPRDALAQQPQAAPAAAAPLLGQLALGLGTSSPAPGAAASPAPQPSAAVAAEPLPEVGPVKAPSTAPALNLQPGEASLVLPGLGPEGAPGSIYDVDPTAMPDKPWRRAGADLSDYFNYGFDEESWKEYGDMKRGRARQREQLMSQKARAAEADSSGAAGGGGAGGGEMPNPYLASLQPAQIQLLQAMQGMMPGMTLEQRAVFMGFIPPPQMQMQMQQQQQGGFPQQGGFDMAAAQSMLVAAQAQGASPQQMQQMQMQLQMQMQAAAAQQAQQQQQGQGPYAGVPSGPAQHRPPPNAPSGPSAARIAPPNRPSPAPGAQADPEAQRTAGDEEDAAKAVAAAWGEQVGLDQPQAANGAVKMENEEQNGNGDDSVSSLSHTAGFRQSIH